MNPKHATVHTVHPPGTAPTIAAAVTPDHTPDITTTHTNTTITTHITRETTGGLRATTDDYLVNLTVAARLLTTVHDNEPNHNPDHADDHNADHDPTTTDSQ